jgi:hypothetical protein
MRNDDRDDVTKRDAGDPNRDPITGAKGAHPVGVGSGATAGGLAGAAIGAAAGPIGAAVGLAAGAIAGGYAGKGVAEYIDPTAEDTYWRENYSSRPYVENGETYDTYADAYRTGYEGRGRYHGRTWDDAETDLRRDYESRTSSSGLSWDRARNATRDAWNRVEEYLPGDADGDGR